MGRLRLTELQCPDQGHAVLQGSGQSGSVRASLQNQEKGKTSLVVQELRLWASSTGGWCSIPGQGTKIPRAMWQKKKKGKERKVREKVLLKILKNKNPSKLFPFLCNLSSFGGFSFLATLCTLQDSSSLIRVWTLGPSRDILTTGPPGNFRDIFNLSFDFASHRHEDTHRERAESHGCSGSHPTTQHGQ